MSTTHDPKAELRSMLNRILALLPADGTRPSKGLKELTWEARCISSHISGPLWAGERQDLGGGKWVCHERTEPLTDEENLAEAWTDQVNSWLAPILQGKPITAEIRAGLAQAAGEAEVVEWLTVTDAALATGIPKSRVSTLCDDPDSGVLSRGKGRSRLVDANSLARWKLRRERRDGW